MKAFCMALAVSATMVGPFAATAHAESSPRELLSLSARALKLGDWSRAVTLTKVAMKSDLSDSERLVATNNLCVGLTNLDDPGALIVCSQSVELSNGHWGCLVNRANLYRQLGRAALADADIAPARAMNEADTATAVRSSKQDSTAFVAMKLR